MPADCPNCGAEVPAGRLSCPECGSDWETGWARDALTGYASTDIPDTWDDDAYQAAIADLPGAEPRARRRTPRERLLLIVAVITLAAFVLVYVL